MQNPSNTADQPAGSPRQWQTQPATGDVVGGCELSTLGALLVAVRDRATKAKPVYFTGVRADYVNEGEQALLRVISTHGSPMTELVPQCELRVDLPVQDLGQIRSFLEDSVRRMVPEVEFVKRQLKVQRAQVDAEQREAQSRNVWLEAGPLLRE